MIQHRTRRGSRCGSSGWGSGLPFHAAGPIQCAGGAGACARALGAGEVNQKTLGSGDLRRGRTVPTLLVNGRDLFGMPTPAVPTMGCRMYEGFVPSPEQIAERLRTLKSSK